MDKSDVTDLMVSNDHQVDDGSGFTNKSKNDGPSFSNESNVEVDREKVDYDAIVIKEHDEAVVPETSKQKAGADFVGLDEFVEKIKSGWTGFDVVIVFWHPETIKHTVIIIHFHSWQKCNISRFSMI